MAIGAVAGALVSVAAYALTAHLTGQEITNGGLAAAAVSGAITGAISGLAGPAAGTALKAAHIAVTSTRIVAGAAIINGVAGATAYATGVTVKNAIDVPAGHASEQITPEGIAFSALLNSGAGILANRLSPVTTGQYSLAQASHFAAGRTWRTLFSTQNAQNQYLQIIEANATGAMIGTAIAPVLKPSPAKSSHQPTKVIPSPNRNQILQAY